MEEEEEERCAGKPAPMLCASSGAGREKRGEERVKKEVRKSDVVYMRERTQHTRKFRESNIRNARARACEILN